MNGGELLKKLGSTFPVYFDSYRGFNSFPLEKSTLMQSYCAPASGNVELCGVLALRGLFLAKVGQEHGAMNCAESWELCEGIQCCSLELRLRP